MNARKTTKSLSTKMDGNFASLATEANITEHQPTNLAFFIQVQGNDRVQVSACTVQLQEQACISHLYQTLTQFQK